MSVRPESKLHKKEYVNAPKWGCSNMRVLDHRDVQKHSCSKTRMLRKHKRPKTRMLKNAKPFRAGMGAVLRLCEGGDSPPPFSDAKRSRRKTAVLCRKGGGELRAHTQTAVLCRKRGRGIRVQLQNKFSSRNFDYIAELKKVKSTG